MSLSSPTLSIDNRLVAIEELFRQQQTGVAVKELARLGESEFETIPHDFGFYLYLRAESHYVEGNFRKALDDANRADKVLGGYPLHSAFGRVQLVLSKVYSAIGDTKNAELRARDALASFRRSRDTLGQVDSFNELARISLIKCHYSDAVAFLEDALSIAKDDRRKSAVLKGNLATLQVITGKWERAERELAEALEYHIQFNHEIGQANVLLVTGALQTRQRRFLMAGRAFDRALAIISRLELKRQKFYYLEFAGELAYEKGDMFKAKATLGHAYEQGMLLAPQSDLVSQAARRLADTELALDNIDEAMKYGQKALEVALKVGEKIEVGLAKRVIGQVFAAQNNYDEALEYIRQAVETVKEVGDPLETARTLLILAEIEAKSGAGNNDRIRDIFDQARRIFKQLELDYWVAETDFRSGVFFCQTGDLGAGFKNLNRAEKVFTTLDDKPKVRAVSKFLKSLSEQAVALSISQENEFKIFGNLITPAELSNIKTSTLEEILRVLLKRTNGDRALVYSPDFPGSPVDATFSLTSHQVKKFEEKFQNLLGEEISKSKPTLILDCRRDPFINGLFSETAEVVGSVLVVPFKMSDAAVSYLYVEKLSHDNGLNPFNQMELNFAVGFSDIIAFKWTEIQKNKLLEDNLRLKTQLREKAAFPNIVTQNSDMLEILAQVQQIVNSNISISIEGETGSGKDVLARAIHYNSDRRDKRFISVNCAALPETLLESELFGYKRGAFTGADHDKAGLFEEADGGTFFLDEIGDMPLNIQAKVLRVLEEKEIVRLGDTVPRRVDVRVVSATNQDLKELMAASRFRQDLYYRLSALTFRLPPLRERRDDIPLLVEHFLTGNGNRKQLSPEVMKMLVGYDWPGNVRELENEVKKLILMAGDNSRISPEIVSHKITSTGKPAVPVATRDADASENLVFDKNYSLYDYLEHHERRFIIKALKETDGVKKHAAELLNIPESTLRLKIKQYNIDLKHLDNLS